MNQLADGTLDVQILEFGPYRAIGISTTDNQFHALWERFVPRMGEIGNPQGEACGSFGICRCIPGVTDGSFEYIAASPAAPDAPVPDDMIEVQIPAGTYAVFPVSSLEVIKDVWSATGAWFEEHSEWEGFCAKDACDCAKHPAFEYYPPEFAKTGRCFIYIPIRKRA